MSVTEPSVRVRALDRPRKLDRYELIAPIGSGGMATIYLGRALGSGGFERLVAIKVCHMHLREEPSFVSMFLDEARLAAQIHHPNVVSTIDVQNSDELYLVMEYVEGGHAAQLIRAANDKGVDIPIPIALRIMEDALEGLQAAHDVCDIENNPLNLIHRDVSPQNVLVGIDGVARLADFGVARAEVRYASTKPGEIKGKISYMAPEQLRGGDLTQKVDIFSAAVVLWELLTGQRLFKGTSSNDSVSKILSDPICKPSSLRPEVPASLDKIARRGLDRNPVKRFQTAHLFAEALNHCGVEPASRADVGRYLSEMLASSIKARKELLRETSGSIVIFEQQRNEPENADTPSDEVSASRVRAVKKRHRPFMIGMAALLLLCAVLATVYFGGFMTSDEETRQHIDSALIGSFPLAADEGSDSSIRSPSDGGLTPVVSGATDASIDASGATDASIDASGATEARDEASVKTKERARRWWRWKRQQNRSKSEKTPPSEYRPQSI